jgi:transposase
MGMPHFCQPTRVRLCKRDRRLVSPGKHPNVVTVAIARELTGFMWAIAKQVPVTPSSQDA